MSAYYNENDPFAAAWLRELIHEGLIANGDVDERSIEEVQVGDLSGFTQCHFFAGIGGWSYALRLAGWPDNEPVTTASCPCPPIPSLRSVLAERKAKMIAAISGRNFGTSIASAALSLSLGNRLQAQFNGDGGIAPLWILKSQTTPLQRPYYVLMPSVQYIREKDYSLWPTPAARDGKDISRSAAFLVARQRHSPSTATRLLERGLPWTVISAIYALAMGFPLSWNDAHSKATVTPSSRKSQRRSSKPASKQSKTIPPPD